jgi:hypothetical protein
VHHVRHADPDTKPAREQHSGFHAALRRRWNQASTSAL